jgi:outer membrane receptor protein involved in Fe transport
LEVFVEPNVNLGELKTNGVDADLNYKLNGTPIGSFKFDVSATYLNSYQQIATAGGAPIQVAGTFDRQFGNYAKLRTLSQVAWSWQGIEGMLSMQYIGPMVIHHPATQSPAVYGLPNPDLQIPSIIYFNLTAGYTIPVTKTRVLAGVQNIGDKQPPIFFQNNVTNANTDVSTYDTLGRRYFVSFQQKF